MTTLRRDFKVDAVGPVKLLSGVESKIVVGLENKFTLMVGDEVIAHCPSSKRLNDWAFENHALRVRHDFDLKLSENEA